MNWQKLNEVETYTHLWNKFKALFRRHKHTEDGTADSKGKLQETTDDNDMDKATSNQDGKATHQGQGSEVRQIDFALLFRQLGKHIWAYAIVLPIVISLSCWYIVNEPRTYTSTTTMAPEISDAGSSGSGSLSSIAQSFGIDLEDMPSVDAITPLLYPDLMNDNGFVTNLFNILIKTSKTDTPTTYYNFLKYDYKVSWVGRQKAKLMQLFVGQPDNASKAGSSANATAFDPYALNIKDDAIAGLIRKEVNIDVDKKTGIISISAQTQDPLASKIIADSVRGRLQDFITAYRTSKSRRDVEYYAKLTNEARTQYEATRRKYAATADANVDVVMESEKSKLEDIENTMQLQYNRYTTLNTQLDAARAKLRQYTPAFTVIQGAAVPVRPAGPKRMLFVLIMTLAATVAVSVYALVKEL